MHDFPAGTFSSPSSRTLIPAKRNPARIDPIPHRYMVSKFPRIADHGIPTSDAGTPSTRNANNNLKEANIPSKDIALAAISYVNRR